MTTPVIGDLIDVLRSAFTDPKSWGADLPGTPVMLNPQFSGAPEPITEFMIPVSTWSDGTAAPKQAQ